jgi:hypothetical protein
MAFGMICAVPEIAGAGLPAGTAGCSGTGTKLSSGATMKVKVPRKTINPTQGNPCLKTLVPKDAICPNILQFIILLTGWEPRPFT